MTMGDQKENRLQRFLTKGWVVLFLSKNWVCCRNFSRVFSQQPPLLLWVMRVYIVWVKGKKVTLKILQIESFAGTSRDGLSCKVLTKCSLALDFSASSMCFSCDLFAETFTHELLASQWRNYTNLHCMLNSSPT